MLTFSFCAIPIRTDKIFYQNFFFFCCYLTSKKSFLLFVIANIVTGLGRFAQFQRFKWIFHGAKAPDLSMRIKRSFRIRLGQHLNCRGTRPPHRESPHEVSALDDQTKKSLSPRINLKFRPNIVPNCGENDFGEMPFSFWSSPRFRGQKTLQFSVETFFWSLIESGDRI